jgi:amidase
MIEVDDFAGLDAMDQAGLVRRGETSPPELVEASISRVERLNPRINAVIRPLFAEARRAADSVNLEAPFAGVPFLLKDLVADLKGTARGDGSAFVDGHYVADHDSELTHRYKAAGLVVIGKSNTSEFGLLPTTEPDSFGPTRNPWNLGCGSGGSSGGSAAAVAAGLVAAAHASDGGGSIRIPASCCGLVGLKPTRGRTSYAPDLGDVAGGILCDHVVTRSVRDSAALLDATAGPVAGDPDIAPSPDRPFLAEVSSDPGSLRIGLGTVALTGVAAHDDCVTAAQATAGTLQALGHEVEIESPVVDSGRLFKSFGGVMTGYLGWSIDKWAAAIGRKPTESDFEAVTWRMYEHSRRQPSADYLMAWQNLQACCRDFAAFFEKFDLWLTPTLVRPPAPLGYFGYDPENRMEHIEHLGHYTGFTLIANASGHPAVSLPLHWNEQGLPIGVQLTGRFGAEAVLLRVAGQLERAMPWKQRRPSLD